MTSAPKSAIKLYGTVPACAVEQDTTFTPSSGPLFCFMIYTFLFLLISRLILNNINIVFLKLCEASILVLCPPPCLWNIELPDIKEYLAHLIQDIKRSICFVRKVAKSISFFQGSYGFLLVNIHQGQCCLHDAMWELGL